MADLAQVHREAKKKLNNILSIVQQERKLCLEDRRFYSLAGAQWEGDLLNQFASKPKFELNKIHLSVIRIFNEYRNNRISVDFISKDGEENDLSDVCDGLYRSDEQFSNAREAYDNAFEEAVGGGMGAWRLRACYEDEEDDENDYQRIALDPIFEADSCVFFDLDAKRQDKRDARHCFILQPMTKEAFRDEYDKDPSDIGRNVISEDAGWGETSPDSIYIAEYYQIEKVKRRILVYKNALGDKRDISEDELSKNPKLLDELRDEGYSVDRDKTVKIDKVRKYIMDGAEILEDCGYIAGKYIPIIPVYGKRWFIEGLERFQGHVRLCKDPQRIINMMLSKLGEISALSSVEKPIVTPEQMAGNHDIWRDDNIENYPYLLLNAVDSGGQEQPLGPVGYTRSPQVPPALATMLQIVEEDLREMLGSQEQGEEMGANLSGKAIELVQNRLDMQSYIYMDNMAKAMRHCGDVWLSMAKDLYVEESRKMKTIDRQGDISSIRLSEEPEMVDNKMKYKNDLKRANFEVVSEVGPSSISRKESALRSLMSVMQFSGDPETIKVITSLMMMNIDIEGAQDVRDYFRKQMVMAGVKKPNEEEKAMLEELANQPKEPTPQETYLISSAQEKQAQAKGAEVNARKTEVETMKVMSDIEKTRADIFKTYADTEREDRAFAFEKTQQATATPQTSEKGQET